MPANTIIIFKARQPHAGLGYQKWCVRAFKLILTRNIKQIENTTWCTKIFYDVEKLNDQLNDQKKYIPQFS